MGKKNIHLVPHGNRWAVKKEGKTDPVSTHRTKGLADNAGRSLAKKEQVEFVIHGKDGRIQDKDSFGNDPHPLVDKKH